MLKKSLNILKSNPVIILFYAAYMVVTILIMFSLYPKDFAQFVNPDITTFDIAGYFTAMIKIFIAVFITYALGLLFLSGFGNMVSEAVINGKTSPASFLPGIKKYFGRILLASLLLMAFTIGFSIVISIITIPLTMFSIRSGSFTNESINSLSIIITLISSSAVILALPFILLWFPSLFIDDAGVIQGLVKGVKAGVKNYWKLILIILMIYLPMGANIIFNYNSLTNGNIFTPLYLVLYLITAILTIVAFPIIFLIYKENKPKQ